MTSVWNEIYSPDRSHRRWVFLSMALLLHVPMIFWKMPPPRFRLESFQVAKKVKFLENFSKTVPHHRSTEFTQKREKQRLVLEKKASALRKLGESRSAGRAAAKPTGIGVGANGPFSPILPQLIPTRSQTPHPIPTVPLVSNTPLATGTGSLSNGGPVRLTAPLSAAPIGGARSIGPVGGPTVIRSKVISLGKSTGSGLSSMGSGGGTVPEAPLQRRKESDGSNNSSGGSGYSGNSAGSNDQGSSFSISGGLAGRHVIRQVAPEYPEWARSMELRGIVYLVISVLPDGRVGDDVRVESSTAEGFNPSAIAAIKQWRFEPLAGGKGEIQKGVVRFTFSFK